VEATVTIVPTFRKVQARIGKTATIFIFSLNLAPLKLKAAGQTEYPDILPVFQLMAWGLANGLPLTHCRTEQELARLSRHDDQQEAMEYLVQGVPGGLSELHRNLLRVPPKAAAHLLLAS
jgi:hypothetical protein